MGGGRGTEGEGMRGRKRDVIRGCRTLAGTERSAASSACCCSLVKALAALAGPCVAGGRVAGGARCRRICCEPPAPTRAPRNSFTCSHATQRQRRKGRYGKEFGGRVYVCSMVSHTTLRLSWQSWPVTNVALFVFPIRPKRVINQSLLIAMNALGHSPRCVDSQCAFRNNALRVLRIKHLTSSGATPCRFVPICPRSRRGTCCS